MSTVADMLGQLKTAVDSNRTDVICTIISTWKKSPSDEDLLQHVLNEPQLDCGTLLHYATKASKADIVRALLSNGADPGVQNSEGKLPLDLANDQIKWVYNEELLQSTAQSNLGRVCQLLAGGVDVNLRDTPATQNTPLHWGVTYSTVDMVQCLATRGANPNSVNAEGRSPLHEAVKRGDISIISVLLSYGADPSLTVKAGPDTGKTAFDLASGLEKVEQLMKTPPRKRTLSSEAAQHELNNHTEKSPLSRLDSSVSVESGVGAGDAGMVNGTAANGVESTGPQLASPSFKPKPHVYDDLMMSPLRAVVTEEKLNLLWPQPQSIVQGGGQPFVIQDHLPVIVAGGPIFSHTRIMGVWESQKGHFEAVGVKLGLEMLSPLNVCDMPHVLCHVNQRLCQNKGSYKITISPKQLKIVCGSLESLNYALCTVLQLLELYRTAEGISVPTLLIDDWPTLHYRGVLLDVSQGRVPNMETLQELLNTLFLLKINQIYLYSRFRSKNPTEWQLCYSRSDLVHLDLLCSARGLQLVPVLEVGPKVQFEDLPLLYTAFQDFVTCCSHSEFVSAGPRLSSFLLDVTDDYLNVNDASRYLPVSRDQTLQLCGYPLHGLSTSLLQQLPPHIVFNEFGVKADHDFRNFCGPLADLGISFMTCPGTAAWNSLAGCPEAALCNIYNAMKCATSQGAMGMVVCNWTGKGHLTHLPFSWAGLLMAAGLSWGTDVHWDFILGNLADLLNQHVYKDKAMVLGHALVELGRAETYLMRCARNQPGNDVGDLPDEHGSVLFQFLSYPDGVPLEYLAPDVIQRAIRHIKKCQAILPNAAMACAQAVEIIEEINLTCDFMMLAAKVGRALVMSGKKPNSKETGYNVVNFGINMLTPTNKTDLANRLLELMEMYKMVWNKRYLPAQGQHESLLMLSSLLRLLVPDKSKEELDHLTNTQEQPQS
ncbi:uncharacterized protein LOC124145584 isoform X2 [Haliotis rufescens]|uniref:uncharacterized protein LOC124145584 isoform X2 n=1 Tax=Haliotis rufescens TaxID=6454 RepID=UPI00201F5C7C|nr:uncharacterized protein LOC124145584 isoform X2 [Haliotis rufescens]